MTTRPTCSMLNFNRPLTLAVSVLGAAALAACGGGGSSSSGLDDGTATAYAANATTINSDALTSSDMGLIAAQSVVQSTATALAAGRPSAQSVGPSARPDSLTSPAVACAGGGTADVVITGGVDGSESNGRLDAGEVYTFQFNACQASATAAPVSGNLVMTVINASGDAANGTLDVTLAHDGLTATLPRGTVSLNGTSTRTATVSTDPDGTVNVTGEFTTADLVLETQLNNRSSTFTLSDTDIQRTATVVDGVVVASSINGKHSLSASLPRGDFSFSTSTSGSATYGADGQPTSGNWTITLPDDLVNITILDTDPSNATITIDRNKDGTVDRTIVVPVSKLETVAG